MPVVYVKPRIIYVIERPVIWHHDGLNKSIIWGNYETLKEAKIVCNNINKIYKDLNPIGIEYGKQKVIKFAEII